MRRIPSEGVRIDRRDLQRIWLLPHRLASWLRLWRQGLRLEGLGLEIRQLKLVVEFKLVVGFERLDEHRDNLQLTLDTTKGPQ